MEQVAILLVLAKLSILIPAQCSISPSEVIPLIKHLNSNVGLKKVFCKVIIGLNVYMDATLFFTLNQTRLHALYYELGDYWYAYLVRCVYSAVKSITVKYTTQDYFQNRIAIGQDIAANVV